MVTYWQLNTLCQITNKYRYILLHVNIYNEPVEINVEKIPYAVLLNRNF